MMVPFDALRNASPVTVPIRDYMIGRDLSRTLGGTHGRVACEAFAQRSPVVSTSTAPVELLMGGAEAADGAGAAPAIRR
jgi:hypothetical protein